MELENYSSRLDFKIKTYEIDIAGHLNNIVYIKWIEDLRCSLFEKIFPIQELMKNNIFPAIVSTFIKYKKQLKYSDSPVGTIKIEYISHGLIELKITFLINGDIAASAVQKCALMNLQTGKIEVRAGELFKINFTGSINREC